MYIIELNLGRVMECSISYRLTIIQYGFSDIIPKWLTIFNTNQMIIIMGESFCVTWDIACVRIVVCIGLLD